MKSRFTLQRLFLSVTLICLGCGTFATAYAYHKNQGPYPFVPLFVAVYVNSIALIMAGIFAPFGRAKLGAIIGILLSIAFVAFIVVYLLLDPAIW